MTIHKSFQLGGAAVGHRNVLTRTERLAKLEKANAWDEEKDGLLKLPKVRSIKFVAKKKKKAKKDEEEK